MLEVGLIVGALAVHLSGARRVDVPGVGHVGLVVYDEAHAVIVAAIEGRA